MFQFAPPTQDAAQGLGGGLSDAIAGKAMKNRPLIIFRPNLAIDNGAAPGALSPGADQQQRFQSLILPHLASAYSLACYLTGDAVLSEDIIQDVFLRAFRGFPDFRGEAPRAWLFAIVRNCCHSALAARRARGRHVTSECLVAGAPGEPLAELPDERETPEAALMRVREIEVVRASIHALPEPFREAIVLRELEELSYKEIAAVTGVAIGTVMSRISRGRELLAKSLLAPAPSAGRACQEAKP